MTVDYEAQLIELVRSEERVMGLLRAVRSLGLDQWCIAAGTIRNLVWDHLHSLPEPTLPSDIDVLVFDVERTSPGYEQELEAQLQVVIPDVT